MGYLLPLNAHEGRQRRRWCDAEHHRPIVPFAPRSLRVQCQRTAYHCNHYAQACQSVAFLDQAA